MERIDYPQLIKDILTQHSINHCQGDTEIQLLFDDHNHHYQVLNIGWQDQTTGLWTNVTGSVFFTKNLLLSHHR